MTGHLTDFARNAALEALNGFVWISLHHSYSAVGDNEFSGFPYARQALAYAGADAGVMQGGSVTFPTPPPGYLAWIGAWDAPTGGNFLGMAPNGSTIPRLFSTEDTVTGVMQSRSHAFVDGDTVLLLTGGFPTTIVPPGIYIDIPYVIVGATADTFQLSLTTGGTPVIPTAPGIGFVQRYTLTPVDGSTDVVVAAFTLDATLF